MKLDVTNRRFLSDLTRAQLLALAVQKCNATLAKARLYTDTELRDLLEVVPGLQEVVRA